MTPTPTPTLKPEPIYWAVVRPDGRLDMRTFSDDKRVTEVAACRWSPRQNDREPDEDERREAIEERRRRRRLTQCQCGTDLPGTCPGPRFCPYSDYADQDDE